MRTFAHAFVLGRLTEDPKIFVTSTNKKVANFTVATSEVYFDKQGNKHETSEFTKVAAWGRNADICETTLVKGTIVHVQGPLKTKINKSEKSGENHYNTYIKLEYISIMPDANRNANQNTSSQDQDIPHPGGYDDHPF